MSNSSGALPYLGSRISLISKAGIRYEGTLYTIDTHESTVALAKVKSFGTEDRQCDRPVPPRDDIYEYIIFRGSDISDLHVCEPPKSTTGLVQQDPAIVKVDEIPVAPPHLSNSGSFPGMPSASAASPPPGSYLSSGVGHVNAAHRPSPPESPTNSHPSVIDTQEFVRKSGGHFGAGDGSRRPYNKLASMGPPPGMFRGNPRGNSAPYVERGGFNRGGYDRNMGGYDGMYDRSYSRGYDNSYDRRPMGPPRRARSGGYRGGRGTPKRANGESPPTKFENDYDFETANEDLAKELEKLKVGKSVSEDDEEEHEPHEEIIDGEPGEAGDICYDKTKSFFDTISSESVDRATGKSVRPNWREERKLNTETFGMNPRRGGRGYGYGGSSRSGYGYGRSSGYRGGFNARGYGYNSGYQGQGYNSRGFRGYNRGGPGGGSRGGW